MDTIEQLKATALQREQDRSERERIEDRKQRLEADLNWRKLRQAAASVVPPDMLECAEWGQRPEGFEHYTRDWTIRFTIPGHAPVLAGFRMTFDNIWQHQGFDSLRRSILLPDDARMWRVETHVSYFDDEEREYGVLVKPMDFKDLGDALLAAERLFGDEEIAQADADEKNAQRPKRKPQADCAPEPTCDEIFLDALANWVRAHTEEPTL